MLLVSGFIIYKWIYQSETSLKHTQTFWPCHNDLYNCSVAGHICVYSVKCSKCDQEYIGETATLLGTRLQEHTDGKHLNSAIVEHISSTCHRYTLDDTNILVREEKWFPGKIREAPQIHKRSPALNRDQDHEITPILLQLLSRDPQIMWPATLPP